MIKSRCITRFLGLALLVSMPFTSYAENVTKFGDYVIHHTQHYLLIYYYLKLQELIKLSEAKIAGC